MIQTQDVDATIERRLAPFRSRSMPMMWWRFTPPETSEPALDRAFRLFGFGDDAPFHHFVCRAEGRPVGAATLSLGAGVAGLGNIAVVPARRRRGIGATAVAAALLEARALDLRVAALSADPLGVGLYRKLGFREVSRHFTYVWSPER